MRSSLTLLLVAQLGLAGTLPAQDQSAADIAAEQASVNSQLDQVQPPASAASDSRPTPGAFGGGAFSPLAGDDDAPITLLGVVSGKVGGSKEYYQLRDELSKAEKAMQPKIDEQVKLKESYTKEIWKIDDQILEVRRKESSEMDKAKDDEARDRIKQQYDEQVANLTDKQDDWAKKKNDADDAIQKLRQDPNLRATQQKFEIQCARDARKYFSG